MIFKLPLFQVLEIFLMTFHCEHNSLKPSMNFIGSMIREFVCV
jgi:hypothetical protein